MTFTETSELKLPRIGYQSLHIRNFIPILVLILILIKDINQGMPPRWKDTCNSSWCCIKRSEKQAPGVSHCNAITIKIPIQKVHDRHTTDCKWSRYGVRYATNFPIICVQLKIQCLQGSWQERSQDITNNNNNNNNIAFFPKQVGVG